MKEDQVERFASDFLPSGFDPIESMRILSDYMQNLEVAYNDLVNRTTIARKQSGADLRAANKTIADLEEEKERLTRELLHLSSQVEEQDNHLSTANHKLANFEKQSKRLHHDNAELESKLIKKENDNNFYLAEVERLKHDYEAVSANMNSANNRADETERRLAAERNQTMTAEKESRRLAALLSEAQTKNTLLEQKLVEHDGAHADEVKRLNEKMGSDAKHEVGLLKKRLKMAITPELDDLEKLSTEKLSAELASNLKALISRLLSKLEQVGFDVSHAPQNGPGPIRGGGR
jgi:chromosome segregation ATPase